MDNRESPDSQDVSGSEAISTVGSEMQAVPNLWFYAFGVLDSEEHDRMRRWLTGAEQAQRELSAIEAYLTELLGEDGRDMLRAPLRSFRAAWDKSHQNLVNFAGALMQMKEGLILSCCERGWQVDSKALQTESLSTKKEGKEDGREVRHRRLVIKGPGGSRISAVHTCAGRVDIDLEFPSAPDDGWVTVFRLVPEESGVTAQNLGIKGKVSGGRAHLKGCPDGFLRFYGPHDYSVDIYLGRAI